MAPKNALKKKNRKETALSRFINENIYIFLAFICSAALMLIVYFCFEVIPFGDKTVLRMDLYHQYGPLFAELYDRLTGFKSLLYSWTSAGGSSFLGNYMNYLSSPIALIILAFGHENIPESIGAMVLIKNALAASTMAYYLKKAHGKNLLRALYQEGITKTIIFLTKEMRSLTLLIPCSLIPSMVGNGVKPIATYAPIMH